LGKVGCTRVEVLDATGSAVVELRGHNGNTYRYVRKLENALMGYVWSAVQCGPPPRREPTAHKVAVKELFLDNIARKITLDGHKCKDDPVHEMKVMKALSERQHPHLCRLLDVFQDDTYLYGVMEYLPEGDLLGHIKAQVHPADGAARLEEDVAKEFFVQALLATQEMHNVGLAHRDLSLGNTMLVKVDGRLQLKVIDFGLCKAMSRRDDGSFDTECGPDRVGKFSYMAPEVFANTKYDCLQADLWSLGVMLFIKLFGVPPFKYPHKEYCPAFNVVERLGLAKLMNHWSLTPKVSAHACDVVLRLLHPQPSNRASMAHLAVHPWLSAYRDQLLSVIGAGCRTELAPGGADET
jgi:serine/threonine protein kinase